MKKNAFALLFIALSLPLLRAADSGNRAEGKRIRAWINGVQTVDYTEPEDSIPQHGRIGLQVHGGGKTEALYRDIMIVQLP